jgi:hypothetical protein
MTEETIIALAKREVRECRDRLDRALKVLDEVTS